VGVLNLSTSRVGCPSTSWILDRAILAGSLLAMTLGGRTLRAARGLA